MMKNDNLGREITTFYENLRKRQKLDEELKETLSTFFALVDEKAEKKELALSKDEWATLGVLANKSVKSTDSLRDFTNFVAEKF